MGAMGSFSERSRADRAGRRSAEIKRENREADRQNELKKQELANQGQLATQRLSNQGYMDVTRLREEGDTSRTKMDLDWKTGNEARNFSQREGQFERAFQQTQSIADRSADQWLKTFEETKNENKLNRQGKLLERATTPGDMGEPAPGISKTIQERNLLNQYVGMTNDQIKKHEWNLAGTEAFQKWGKLETPEEMVRFAKSATPEIAEWFKSTGVNLDDWKKKKINRSMDYTLSPYGL